MTAERKHIVERVQTGVRMEKRLLKVLRALADSHDLTLGDLLEGIVLHAFDGKCPFGPASRLRIRELKKFYGLDLDSRASHRLAGASAAGSSRKGRGVELIRSSRDSLFRYCGGRWGWWSCGNPSISCFRPRQ